MENKPAVHPVYDGQNQERVALFKSGRNKDNNAGIIEKFSRIIDQSPDDASAYYSRAEVKTGVGDFSGAPEDFNKSVEISRMNSDKFLADGIAEYKKCNYKQALGLFSKAVESNPNCCEAFFYRAKVKSDLGDFGKAISDLNEAIRLNPVYTAAYKSRGMIKAILGDYFGAWQDIRFADS